MVSPLGHVIHEPFVDAFGDKLLFATEITVTPVRFPHQWEKIANGCGGRDVAMKVILDIKRT